MSTIDELTSELNELERQKAEMIQQLDVIRAREEVYVVYYVYTRYTVFVYSMYIHDIRLNPCK